MKRKFGTIWYRLRVVFLKTGEMMVRYLHGPFSISVTEWKSASFSAILPVFPLVFKRKRNYLCLLENVAKWQTKTSAFPEN